MKQILSNPHLRLMIYSGTVYLFLLIGVIVTGAFVFSDLYVAPTEVLRSAFPATVPLHQSYVTFLTWSGLGMAAYISIWAAIFGILQKSFLQGVFALASGGIITIFVFSALPWIYYPYDQYSASAAWIFTTGVPMVFLFATTSLLGRYLWKKRKVQMA